MGIGRMVWLASSVVVHLKKNPNIKEKIEHKRKNRI
jgi:hypothetical protein